MERTDELKGLLAIYMPPATFVSSSGSEPPSGEPSPCLDEAVHAFTSLRQSNELVQRICRLSVQREFSNDPSVALSTTSGLFKKKIGLIQNDLKRLERTIANPPLSLQGGRLETPSVQAQHHRKLILQILQRESTAQMQSIQVAIKAHSENVKQRQKRVERYGSNIDVMALAAASPPVAAGGGGAALGGREAGRGGGRGPGPYQGAKPFQQQPPRSPGHRQSNKEGGGRAPAMSNAGADAAGASAGGSRYAMFGDTSTLRRRGVGVDAPGSGGAGMDGGPKQPPMQEQQFITPRATQHSRLQSAERVEASIAQMGALFGQMANLVMAQGETIARIEDDVEAGLVDTEEGHREMQKFLEITKGNRGIILKVFALLVFFILLFMFWT